LQKILLLTFIKILNIKYIIRLIELYLQQKCAKNAIFSLKICDHYLFYYNYYFYYYCYRLLIEELIELIEARSYRDRSSEHSRKRRDRSKERRRDRDRDRDRDRSRERRDVASHYIEPPIRVPIYYVSCIIPYKSNF